MSNFVWRVVLAVICVTSLSAAAEVKELTDTTFDSSITSGVWLVKFYAPWCGHCKKLAPIFDQLAKDSKLQEANAHIAKVDCTNNKELCSRFGVRGYPTLKVIANGQAYEYNGARDHSSMVKFVIDGYKSVDPEEVLTKDNYVEKQIQAEKEIQEAEKSSKVVTLTSSSFDSLVNDKSDGWFLKFYAPWCGHCKRLSPTWDRLSTTLNEKGAKMKVGKIDCTKHRRICSRFGVSGYPSLFMVKHGVVYKYSGARQLESFLEFEKGGYKTAELIGNIPGETIFSAVVDSVLEWATEHTLLAIFGGILILAVIVAMLVYLLDYCMGEEEFHIPKERLEQAEQLLQQQQQQNDNDEDDDEPVDHPEKVVDGTNKAN